MSSPYDKIPIAAKRYPFFYGWIILGLGALGFVASSPGQTYGVAPFTDPLIEALGMTRTQLSMAYMFGTIASSLCLTYAGRLYDRFGARVMAPVSSVALGLVLVLLSQCDRLSSSVAQALPAAWAGAVTFVLMLLLFFALRFSGQGVLTMVSRNMMMKWFDRHRGLVTGISGMIISPAFSAMPAVFNSLVVATSWRHAWLWLAAIVGAGFSVVALLFFRDSPEDCELLPDGPLADKALGSHRSGHRVARQYTLPEARRTYALWVFTFGIALFGLYITAMSFHAGSLFQAAGLPRQRGYLIFFQASLLSLVLRPFVGWAADRVALKYLLMAMLLGVITSAIGLANLSPGPSRWIVVAGNGICGALLGTLSGVTWPNFYGREHLGAISGFSMSVVVFASALGPWLFSQSNARTGSYDTAAFATLAVAAILLLSSVWANNPQQGAPDTPVASA